MREPDRFDLTCPVNRRFCSQSGYSEEEILGANVRILKSGETKPEAYAGLWSTLRAGRVWRGEFVTRTKSGEQQLESVTILPVANAQGAPTCFVALKEDITLRRQEESREERG